MRISSAFPSTYLKAADLQGRTAKVVMDKISMEDVGGEPKPVLYFKGKEKGVVLNKTNANNIAMVYGDDTDNWGGGEVELFPAMVDFQGRSVEAIRIRAKANFRQNAQQPAPAPNGNNDLNDEVPF